MVLESLILVFGLLTASAFLAAVGMWVVERRRRADERDADLDAIPGKGDNLILGRMTPALAQQLPIAGERVSAIGQELREAGFYQPSALVEYQAVRATLVFVPLIAGGIFTALAPRPLIPAFAFGTLIAAGIGASVPRYYINLRARLRARQIERGLPIALDLVNLGLSAGQTIFAAMMSVADRIRKPFPILAKEFDIVREQAELTNLSLALQHFADRTNVPDVRNLAMVLVQSDRLGTDVSSGLLEFCNNLRTNLRHRAEARANRANFWMLVPTIGCLWISAAMMLILPVYHDVVEKRNRLRESSAADAPATKIPSGSNGKD